MGLVLVTWRNIVWWPVSEVNLSRGAITTFETPPEVLMSWRHPRRKANDLYQKSIILLPMS